MGNVFTLAMRCLWRTSCRWPGHQVADAEEQGSEQARQPVTVELLSSGARLTSCIKCGARWPCAKLKHHHAAHHLVYITAHHLYQTLANPGGGRMGAIPPPPTKSQNIWDVLSLPNQWPPFTHPSTLCDGTPSLSLNARLDLPTVSEQTLLSV